MFSGGGMENMSLNIGEYLARTDRWTRKMTALLASSWMIRIISPSGIYNPAWSTVVVSRSLPGIRIYLNIDQNTPKEIQVVVVELTRDGRFFLNRKCNIGPGFQVRKGEIASLKRHACLTSPKNVRRDRRIENLYYTVYPKNILLVRDKSLVHLDRRISCYSPCPQSSSPPLLTRCLGV